MGVSGRPDPSALPTMPHGRRNPPKGARTGLQRGRVVGELDAAAAANVAAQQLQLGPGRRRLADHLGVLIVGEPVHLDALVRAHSLKRKKTYKDLFILKR